MMIILLIFLVTVTVIQDKKNYRETLPDSNTKDVK